MTLLRLTMPQKASFPATASRRRLFSSLSRSRSSAFFNTITISSFLNGLEMKS